MFFQSFYVFPIVVVVAFVLITASVKILREYERAVVFTLGSSAIDSAGSSTAR